MSKRILSTLLVLVMALSLFAGCAAGPAAHTSEGQTDPSGEASQIAQIIIGTTSTIEAAVRGEYAFDMLASGVSEMPLVYQDTNGSYHPLLVDFATEDAATWTYTIREGMTWSDGTPVTAEDILFTLQYEDESGSANLVDQTDDEGNVTKAKYTGYTLSEDNRSISLTLAAADVRALSDMTSFRVMPKHIYQGKDSVTEAEARIGCGPYRFESFNKEAGTITFVADPNYPEAPNVGKIIYRIFSNEDTMYMALQTGDIDFVWNYSMGVSATYQDVLASSDTVTLEGVPSANEPAVLAFNNATGPFVNKDLRLAVSYALDYSAFKTYFGSVQAQTPNAGFVPPTTLGYKQTEQLRTDLDKARAHLAAAGYTTKNGDGFYVDADGSVLGFALTVNAGKANHMGCAELIKTTLEAFGIQVTLDAVDGAAYNAKTSNKFSENNITMEAAIYGYTAAGMGMMNGLGSIYVDGTHPVQGGAQVYDQAFQQILARMSGAKTIQEYTAAAGELQDFYADQRPVLALYWDDMVHAYSSRYTNITIDPAFGVNNVNNWFTITGK